MVSNNNGPTRLLLNDAVARNSWLMARLEGVKDNRYGLGARMAVFRKGERPLWRRVHTDGSYLSAHDTRVHFGLGSATSIDAVEVHWSTGDKERWTDVKANSVLKLRQGSGQSLPDKRQ